MDQVKVSVCMIAYNHQTYIAQALDSILAQKTNFPFEIVIGDDNSTDDTGKICQEYAIRYPGKIRYHLREKNLGMMPNFITTLYECQGTYIALCEGDDYWIDETKLQTQADFLDAHPDHSLCCHNHFLLYPEKMVPVGLQDHYNGGVPDRSFLSYDKLFF
jgi:glycosyltransferase involved in cell wall biosynthesis